MKPIRFVPEFAFVAALSTESRRLFDLNAFVSTPRRNHLLLRKGEPVTGAYFVLSGALRVFTFSASGVESLLYRVEAGEGCLLALNCVFSELRYPAWVSVETDQTRLLTVPGPVLRELHEREPAVRRYFFEVLSLRLFDLMTMIEQLTTLNVDERLRSYLLRRAGATNQIQITHADLAVHLATSREVVSRQLQRLSAKGIIRTARGVILIRQPEALR